MSFIRRRLMISQNPIDSFPSIDGLIARYSARGLTNEEMSQNPILKDLTDNGHDITCHNFAWGGMSGIGGYLENYNQDSNHFYIHTNRISATKTNTSFHISSVSVANAIQIYYQSSVNQASFQIPSYNIKVSGLTDGQTVIYNGFVEGSSNENLLTIEKDGVYELPSFQFAASANVYGFIFSKVQSSCNITIEQLPLYPNALVSDGVDDYGICENFPILTKEKGYTVVALRKWLDVKASTPLLSNSTDASSGAFIIEESKNHCGSFGEANNVVNVNDNFVYQTSISYNGQAITQGDDVGTNILNLFRNTNTGNNYSSAALYDLLIYDRDLTEEEIGKLKRWLMYQQEHQEDTTSDWYGVEWYTDDPQSSVRRIGNVNLHKSLPIQSGMYRCILNDNGEEVYKLDPNDSTKKEDGTAAVLDGTDGQVMVYIPVFYAKFETQGYRRRVMLSSRSKSGFKKMGGCYVSAYESAIDRTTSGTPKLASVVNTTANFRGGNNNSEWDGTYRSLLGMPATATSLTNFRAYARNRNNGDTKWNCMDYTAYKAIYWLYIVEYADRNCQIDFNDELTAEGYRQGGLGIGVTNINGAKWYDFNSYYPFIPCGHTNSLGNKTGVVAFTMPDEYDAETPLTTYVPSYRGIENPFGHIWKWTDGIHIRVQSEEAGGKSILYTSDHPASYQDTNYEGYEEKGYISQTGGYVKDILFGDGGDMIVKEGGATGASTTTYFSDYFYTNIPTSGEALRGVRFGGNADSDASAGFAFANSNYAPSNTAANVGSRLCYIPNNNNN